MITYFRILFLLYVHLAHLILLLRLCVDMDNIPALCMTVRCMTTFLMYDCLSHVHMYPLISKPLVSVDFVSLGFVFGWRLVAPSLLVDRASD